MGDVDDYGEHEPAPGWLTGILSWAAEARSWLVMGLLVWIAVLGSVGLVAVVGVFIRALVAC